MSLAPGTKVIHKHTDSATVGTVVTVMHDGDGDPADAYMIRWPSGWTSTEPGESLTVVESAAEAALREIRMMLRLPPDAQPAAIIAAVADLGARLFAEVSKPPVCVKIDRARFVSLGNVLRTVPAEAVRDGDWVWGHYRTDDRAIVVWGAPCQKEPHHKTFADRNYIIGPDPATLICEASPAPAEETVWGEP